MFTHVMPCMNVGGVKFLIFVLQISYSDGVCKLEISEVYPEDEGSYTCVASNDAGEAKTTAKMFVKGKGCTMSLFSQSKTSFKTSA